ncbi:hypothetical protein FMN50_20285 [Rhodobacterales bacterium]|nr:hypothetical protein FMN50_20285 [Rhodobacterales bacterium]
MTSQPGTLKSSCNAGEFSPDLEGKVTLKQWYSAAKKMKNVEPVPQSGFRLMPGTVLAGIAASANVKHGVLKVTPTLSYTLIFSPGRVDIFRSDRVKVATKEIAAITADLLPELKFYGEANTFGVFNQDLETVRLFRDPNDDTVWTVDLWPYEKLPDVDLGGEYEKDDDVWEIGIRWSDGITSVVIDVDVDGEFIDSIEITNLGGGWPDFTAALQAQLRELPSMSDGVSVSDEGTKGQARYRLMRITFGGDLSGAEYSVNARILNTAEASVLSYHREIGKTHGEPLVSTDRGWFEGVDLFQDRAIYHGPKARGGAVAMSRVGEYFDLNIEAAGDSAARLEALRTETSERVRFVYEGIYLLGFTDQGEWFVSNRQIKADEPVNWVRTSRHGIHPQIPPFEMEGRVFFVSSGRREIDEPENFDIGQALYSMVYDDVATNFSADPESLLASHLIRDVNGGTLQKKVRNQDAGRLWLWDAFGRLVLAVVIKNQDIVAFCEWIAADAGKVVGASVDGQNQVWLTIDRGGTVTHEVMEEQDINLFQSAVRGSTDLAGEFSGLEHLEGREVWARADGYILGPYTVSGGTIDLGDPYESVTAGLWQPPLYEGLPLFKMLPNEEIIHRPGRVHSVIAHVIDTESIAMGANGSPPRDRPLVKAGDDMSKPIPPKTQQVRRTGMPGHVMGPTVVITQTRPGMLRVRDYTPEAKL